MQLKVYSIRHLSHDEDLLFPFFIPNSYEFT